MRMFNWRSGLAAAVVGTALWSGGAAVAEGTGVNVVGLAYEPLDLFSSTDEMADPVGTASAGDFSFPTPVLKASGNGMVLLKVNGAEYWVIADDVETDRTLSLDIACEPEMKGSTVEFGSRGLGEGCAE
ncbi:hypothetical protein [Roseospirillum parvum]|uniref:Uncharacterized protein n=1 Tax=Roseospirillum parvum TaxID=83401 RepID=A0A1G7YBC7_9PROT|nr:hypothetical protein [Roseospirillum parvum]SDG93714.1 hypothetical protein SAMN05421742_103250 [Roseospirillum parvum]